MAARCDHAFHVDAAGEGRWEVIDHNGRILGHRRDQGEAIELAIQEAQHVHGQLVPGREGDIAVCVEQPDGHYSLAWAPR